MQDLKFTTSRGQDIILADEDMLQITKIYEVQLTADFIRDNYENWSEEKIQWVAQRARQIMDKYGEFEEDAIFLAKEEYLKYHF